MKSVDLAAAHGLRWQCRAFEALTSGQLYAALRLRHAVFVVEQACDYLDLDGLDPKCDHLLAEDMQGSLVACARILPPALKFDEPSIGRVVVAASHRGQGIGQVLMARAIDAAAKAYTGQPVRISAQAHLEGYYGRFGFRAVGEVYDDEGIPHVDMLRAPGR